MTDSESTSNKKEKTHVSKLRSLSSRPLVLVFIVLFAAISAYLLFHSFAAGNFVASEAETGAAAPAIVITDTTASGGKALQFNAASSSSTFMSYPLQSCTTSINGGSNIVVANKSWKDCRGQSALVITGANNVYLHDLDFDGNSGDIFLVKVTGTLRIENIRARNTGAGRTTNGSGQGEVIQLNNTFQGAPSTDTTAGIRNVKSYGGNTEDMISIFQSGGLDSSHPLIIEDIHEETPLPPDPLAWSSGSGTCINLADANTPGTGHIRLRNSTFMNCGQAGIQMNVPTDVIASNNIVYGAARATSNVGLTQWASSPCSTCTGNSYTNNRVWWVKSNGTASALWLSGTVPVSTSGNVLMDTTINPSSLKVTL